MARRLSSTISDDDVRKAEEYRLQQITLLGSMPSTERTLRDLESWKRDTAINMAERANRRNRERLKADCRAHCKWRKESYASTIERRGNRYGKCRFANFEITDQTQADAVRRLRAWCDDLPQRAQRGENLLLFGTVGCGKDHLLGAVVRQSVLRFGLPVCWVTGAALCKAWRTDGAGDPLRNMYLVEHKDPCVLAISDPAPGGPLTPFLLERMMGVVDRQYSEGGSLWVTINGTGRESLETAIGAPIVDRLVHNATIIACDWPSYRKPL